MKKYFTLFILLFSFCFIKTVNANVESVNIVPYIAYWKYYGYKNQDLITKIPPSISTLGGVEFISSNGIILDKDDAWASQVAKLKLENFPSHKGSVSFVVGVSGAQISAVALQSASGQCTISQSANSYGFYGTGPNESIPNAYFYNVTCNNIVVGGGDHFAFMISPYTGRDMTFQMWIQSNWTFATDEQVDTNQKLDDIDKNQQETNKKLDESNKKQDETNKKLGDLNDTLNDNDVDSTSSNSFFGNFNDDDHGLSSIITAPLSFIKNLTSQSCTPISFKIPFVDNTFQFPCFSTYYNKHFGTVFTLYQTIIFGIVSYYICIQIYGLVKGFKDPDNDRIEVLEL